MTDKGWPRLGARAHATGTSFRVWAPWARAVEVVIDGEPPSPLARDPSGHWSGDAAGVGPGRRYRYALDGLLLPDPASRAQPDGVHGPSAVADPAFPWSDDTARVPAVVNWVLYEIHVGSFTRDGTFDGVLAQLDRLAAVGVNAVELMPVAEFPGTRNWGYDGVFPSAAHHAYGGLDGLRRLVDGAHARGIAVVLDVVYNHLGPEGNVLADFGPYFSDRYATPWGAALNFDGTGSDHVRELFVDSACSWLALAHLDGLRLDALHAIVDRTAYPFVEQLTDALHEEARRQGRPVVVIGESSDNDPRLTMWPRRGGRGLDAQWSDDFHHALHVAITGERHGYYVDFRGGADLAEAYRHGFVHRGTYSTFRDRRHGRAEPPVALDRLVVYGQNHDQVGNRARGERLVDLAGFEGAKLGLACTLLAPSIPLLFMGEERAARTPFPYFVSHSEPELVDAVCRGRASEFPDAPVAPFNPQAEETFGLAVLEMPGEESQPIEARAMEALCRDLVAARSSSDALGVHAGGVIEATWDDTAEVLIVARTGPSGDESILLACFANEPRAWTARTARTAGWQLLCDTDARAYAGAADDPRVDGDLSPKSARVLLRRGVQRGVSDVRGRPPGTRRAPAQGKVRHDDSSR